MHTKFLLPSKNTSTSTPPTKIDIFNILHIQYQKKTCVKFYDLRKTNFYEKACHVHKTFNAYPYPFKGQSE